MSYIGNAANYDREYVPPMIGNGNMSFQVDYEGAMEYAPKDNSIKNNPSLRIWWAGRRYESRRKELIPFGRLERKLSRGERILTAEKFEQTLNVEKAEVCSVCEYSENAAVKTRVFVHHNHNLIAVTNELTEGESAELEFSYRLADIENAELAPKFFNYSFCSSEGGSIDINYEVGAGLFDYKGVIRLFSQGASCGQIKGNLFTLKTTLEKNKPETFYILFADSVDAPDYSERSESLKAQIKASGIDKVIKEHRDGWAKYYAEGYAKLGDESIDKMYQTAQYHLKCFTSDWSVPVGLNDALWNGKYFAFDEFYMFMGLLTSNHISLAKKIPMFRAAGLKSAISRGSSGRSEAVAKYPWQTLEDGSEGSSPGFWLDHIFHMACIACGEYYYYKFTNDKEFLENTAYPVIKRCALFFLNQTVYKTSGGKTIIGKCTDLERLGSQKENAYMTTCGAIKTLRICTETAKVLGVDEDLVKKCEIIGAELFNALPQSGGMYVPYPDCAEASIALLSGTYPFDVIEKGSEPQARGIEKYLASEQRVGNMYAVGSGVCSWYMTWKALVFARLGRIKDAYAAIKSVSRSTGRFHEMFEINHAESSTYYRPWFTTAAGMAVHAVNEMLVYEENGCVCLANALPKECDSFSMRLATTGGTLEAQVENGRLKKLCIVAGSGKNGEFVKVKVPKHICCSDILGDFAAISEENENGTVLNLRFSEEKGNA